MTNRTLVQGGCILTLDPGTGNLSQGDLLIEDGVVAEVAPAIRTRNAEVVDANGAIVMPGFVDCHRHAWHALFRNHPDGPTSAELGPHLSADDIHAATLGGLAAAIDSGITTVADWFDLGPDPELSEAALSAHAESGIRSVFVAGPVRSGDWSEWVRDLHAGWGDRPLSLLAAGIDSSSPEETGARRALAASLEIGVHGHARRAEELAPSPVGTVVAVTKLGPAELDTIKQAGAAVCLTPAADMAAGPGAPPIQLLIDRGIRPGLGVGSERFSPGDLFAQMRAVISMQHAVVFDRKLAGKGALPTLLTTREVIRYATSDGARAVGWGTRVGTLSPGSRADLIVLRADRPNIFPINDPIGAVVWGMDTSNVDWVFVDGHPRKRAGELVADVSLIREKVMAASTRVAGASGLLAETGGPW